MKPSGKLFPNKKRASDVAKVERKSWNERSNLTLLPESSVAAIEVMLVIDPSFSRLPERLINNGLSIELCLLSHLTERFKRSVEFFVSP